MDRISVEELHEMLQAGSQPTIIDVRSSLAQAQGRIPGAIALKEKELAPLGQPTDEIIVYCDCPNDASAAVVSKRLMAQGYGRVRPLAGGIEAWLGAGYRSEEHTSELQSLMSSTYAVFCLNKKKD